MESVKISGSGIHLSHTWIRRQGRGDASLKKYMHLLIISCSQRKTKVPGEIPALDRYDGPTYRCLRKFSAEFGLPHDLRILIISAKHHLIFPETCIADYNLRMTRRRAAEMAVSVQADLRRCLQFYRIAYGGTDQVFLNLGKHYRQVLEGFQWGLLPRLEASGGIGLKTQQMKAWLERCV